MDGAIMGGPRLTEKHMAQMEAMLNDILSEVVKATSKHGMFNTKHEAWGVLDEEVNLELKLAILRDGTSEDIREEAIQVAAMALEIAYQFGLPDMFRVNKR